MKFHIISLHIINSSSFYEVGMLCKLRANYLDKNTKVHYSKFVLNYKYRNIPNKVQGYHCGNIFFAYFRIGKGFASGRKGYNTEKKVSFFEC